MISTNWPLLDSDQTDVFLRIAASGVIRWGAAHLTSGMSLKAGGSSAQAVEFLSASSPGGRSGGRRYETTRCTLLGMHSSATRRAAGGIAEG